MKFTYCDINNKTFTDDINLLFPGFAEREVLAVMSPMTMMPSSAQAMPCWLPRKPVQRSTW